jgi:hypothetical protein
MEGIKVFISYSHKDEDLRDELDAHLKSLQRQKLIETWHDRAISPGEEWRVKIDEELELADIILLLVSADFMASDYCYEKELERALERHKKKEARLIPIIVRAVNWEGSPFAELQALPKDGLAVTLWPDRDAAWRSVVEGIKKAANELSAKQSSQLPVPFTNREDEMKNILLSTAPAYHLLYAPAGCGKTELLRELGRRFKERGWYCAYVALTENSSDKDLASDLAKQLDIQFSPQDDIHRPSRQIGRRLQQKWQSGDKKEGLVLLVDFEKVPSIPILHKLIESFIPDIQGSLRVLVDFASKHNRFRVIIAGRNLGTHLEAEHHRLPLNLLRLSPFSYDVIRNSAIEYLPGHDQTAIDQLSAHLFFITGGHPGCMARTLEMYKEIGIPPDDFLEDYGNTIWRGIVRDCVESILGEIPDSHGYLRESLERVSVFRFLDYGILKELNEALIPETLDEYQLADALTTRYLLDWKGRFLRDEIAWRLLTIKLRNESPNEFPKRCVQAMGICADRLRQPNVGSPEIWTIEYLYQLLQCHAVSMREPEQRKKMRGDFPEQVHKALGIFYDRKVLGEKWRGEKGALTRAIKEDWEFQFTVNYYLRDNNYNEDPYNKMLQQIDQFFA